MESFIRNQPKLTIGMAAHSDFNGVYFSIMALRTYHKEVMPECEIIVVDNDPESEEGKTTRGLFGWLHSDVACAQYIAMPEAVGTTQPRNRVFSAARGKYVLCMDCHVLVYPGALRKLIDFYERGDDEGNLIQGVLTYDDLIAYSTHFQDEWRAEMWGTWGSDPRGAPRFDAGDFRHSATPPEAWAWPEDKPFEIPAQGLGLFSARKDAWLGFNPAMRGFGGEEMYIHEKYRRAGKRTMCLPYLRWIHRFGRPGGVKYPLSVWYKVRNYVIGHAELGLPFDRLKEHFVDTPIPENGNRPLMPLHEWEQLIANPLNPVEWPKVAAPTFTAEPGCQSCGGGVAPDATLEDLYQVGLKTGGDINEHCPTLRALAASCEHVTEFGMRHGVSTVAFLAGQPRRFITYDLRTDPIADALMRLQGRTQFDFRLGSSLEATIEETDLLFIDTVHNAEYLWKELQRHHEKVRRYIVLHDTVIYGEHGDDGKAGLLAAVRRFLREQPQWSVVKHYRNNNGLLIISRDPQDKRALPSVLTMAWNYGRAWMKHQLNGQMASEEQFEARLTEACSLCESRVGNRCSECGCFLDEMENGQPGKATFKEAECPLGFWQAIDQRFSLPIVGDT